MFLEALFIAGFLGRDPALVWLVWEKAQYSVDPIIAIALVEEESWFNPRAVRLERDSRGRVIGTSWGLYQLCDRWHYQFRDNLPLHCWYGAAYLAWCIHVERGDVRRGLTRYNGANGGPWYADAILAVVRMLRSNPLVR